MCHIRPSEGGKRIQQHPMHLLHVAYMIAHDILQWSFTHWIRTTEGEPWEPQEVRADLQQSLDGGYNRQVEGDHDKEDSPAQHSPQLPLPHPPPAAIPLSPSHCC